MNDNAEDERINLFSPERMAVYQSYAPDGSLEGALKLSKWDDLVCCYVWGEIRTFEILLRNRIAQRLRMFDFSQDENEKTRNQWWQQKEYFKLKKNEDLAKMLENAAQTLKKYNKGTEGHFIAELPLGFWTGCLSPRKYFRDFWKDHLKIYFPFIEIERKENQTSMKAEKEALKNLHKKLDDIRRFLRNPIAHHHPMIDKQDLLKNQLRNLYQIVNYISPDIQKTSFRKEELEKILNNPPFPLQRLIVQASSSSD